MWPGMYLFVECVSCGFREGLGLGGCGGMVDTYPRRVRQMLTRTSAPQPATRRTPTGGTGIWVSRACFDIFSGIVREVVSQKRVMMIRRTALAVLAMSAIGLSAGVSGVLIWIWIWIWISRLDLEIGSRDWVCWVCWV